MCKNISHSESVLICTIGYCCTNTIHHWSFRLFVYLGDSPCWGTGQAFCLTVFHELKFERDQHHHHLQQPEIVAVDKSQTTVTVSIFSL